MRKKMAVLLFVGMIALTAVVYTVRNWDPYRSIPPLTLSRLNSAEADWYEQGIQDYRIRAQVLFSAERRQYEIVVRDAVIDAARSAEWDEEAGAWAPLREIGSEEAAFFTVPGIFGLLRADLLNEAFDREVLRMELGQETPYPVRVFLGRIVQDGIPQEGTELMIEVLDFELLAP